jgi:predicted acetyltransferase
MQIQKAEEEDIREIVPLLKASLGESLMPKSEAYWRWKHVENPFGPSPVLIAKQDGRIIGVRAFMRWQWIQGGKIFKAVRAVDTATHPDYQGKGIFKRLTLSLLDSCKAEGVDFVFNTPNLSSKPGYLKMGWQEAGKLPILLHTARPFTMMMNAIRKPSFDSIQSPDQSVKHFINHPGLDTLIKNYQEQATSYLVTNYTKDYLRWRYETVTVANYRACGVEETGKLKALLFYRIKSSRAGNELRITDIFVLNNEDAKALWSLLRDLMKMSSVDYVTLSGCALQQNLFRNLFLVKLNIGPMVTVRDLLMENSLSKLNKFKSWKPSFGDLELF